MRRHAIVIVALLIAGTLLSAAPATADVRCEVYGDDGECTVYADPDPAPGGGGGSGGASGGGSAACVFEGEPIACQTEFGYWSNSLSCWVRLKDPQPPMTDAVWAGRTEGAIYECTMAQAGSGLPGSWGGDLWLAVAPSGVVVPREVADTAIEQMAFRAPEIGLTGKSDDPTSMQIIGLPTWMWVADPDENTVGPITRSASAGGITVTATATLERIVWSMGDGRTVTCGGPGTPYEARYDDQPSPTCGHRYDRTSAGQAHEAFTVTATSYWTVTWAGGGQSGTINLDFTRSTQLRVGELQVIVTDGSGR